MLLAASQFPEGEHGAVLRLGPIGDDDELALAVPVGFGAEDAESLAPSG